MTSPWVPERADAQPPRKKRVHVTLRAMLGWAIFAAGVVTGWAAIDGMVALLAGLVVAAVLVAVGVTWAFCPPRGVPALYTHAPQAADEAREHGQVATAVVEDRTVGRSRPYPVWDVTYGVLVVGPDGRRYRTTTTQLVRRGAEPAHDRGDVVVVRVHPEQRGVVVIADGEPTAPPPETPRRPVPTYSGVPRHTRGRVVSELAGGLLILGAMTVGILVPFTVLALVDIYG